MTTPPRMMVLYAGGTEALLALPTSYTVSSQYTIPTYRKNVIKRKIEAYLVYM